MGQVVLPILSWNRIKAPALHLMGKFLLAVCLCHHPFSHEFSPCRDVSSLVHQLLWSDLQNKGDHCAGFEYSLLSNANIVLKLQAYYLTIKIMQGYLRTSYFILSCPWPLVSICVLWMAAKVTLFLTTHWLCLCCRKELYVRICVGAHNAGGQLTMNLPLPWWIDASCSLLVTSRPFTTKLKIWKSTWSYFICAPDATITQA